VLAAPLLAGNDLSPYERPHAPHLDEEGIAVNQDSLKRQGRKVRNEGDLEVWRKPLKVSRIKRLS